MVYVDIVRMYLVIIGCLLRLVVCEFFLWIFGKDRRGWVVVCVVDYFCFVVGWVEDSCVCWMKWCSSWWVSGVVLIVCLMLCV